MRSKQTKPIAKFQVGDRVQFQFGGRKVWGTITEDNGPIGVNGRRLYRISMPMDPYDPEPQWRPEEEIEPDTISLVPLEKPEIISFLKNSGLKGILVFNLFEEREDPCVWLCRSLHGEITFTFSRKRGVIGGEIIPFCALWEGKRINVSQRDEVATFLRSFGLTPQEAEDVIQSVGTSPVKKPHRRKASKA